MAAALIGLGVSLALFLKLERSGKPETAVRLLAIILIFELLAAPNEAGQPVGLFRVPVGVDLRPGDFIIPVAVLARILARPLPHWIGVPAMLWASFYAWYSVAVVTGIAWGNPMSDVIFQSRSIVSLAGAMFVAAGVDASKIFAPESIARFGRFFGWIAVVIAVAHLTLTPLSLNVPVFAVKQLGILGGDARTVLPVLGMFTLAAEVLNQRRRPSVLIPGAAVFMTPFVAVQAGPYLAALTLVLLVVGFSLTSTWRRRVGLKALDIAIVGSALVTLGAASIFLSGGQSPAVVAQFEDAVLSDSQQTTTNERYQLWDEAVEKFYESPVWGYGVGVKGTIERSWPQPSGKATFHNIIFDISMRSGGAGVLLFLGSLVATVVAALLVWFRCRNDTVAVMSLACMLGMTAILSRGGVSSMLEASRMSLAVGLLSGLILSGWRYMKVDEARQERLEGSQSGLRLPEEGPFEYANS
ncbi:MAG: O-antigen ligase family protein [Acidimicrobiales bacterium]|nr:O-antigen ligase family protein [Acidimicrobiales bacterium]